MVINKTIHELRTIAQRQGIKFSFSDDAAALAQKIATVQEAVKPLEPIIIPKPEYDARLMDKPPSKKCAKDSMIKRLQPYIARGLIVTFPDEETWHMQRDKKQDSGTMRMPERIMMEAADRLLR